MTKPWKIVTTVLIAVVIPPGMVAWTVPSGWFLEALRTMAWDLSYLLPAWVLTLIPIAVIALWFVLPWVGIIWLLLKIWRPKASKRSPRITVGKG